MGLLFVFFFLNSNKNFKISHFNALRLAAKELLVLYGKTDFVEDSFTVTLLIFVVVLI